jgi:putative ABC transport system permease protein
MAGASAPRRRAAASLLVARALARSLLHRPVRLMTAVAGGIGGVLLVTALMMIAWPVLESTRTAPVEGVDPNTIAVAARAPSGMSGDLVTRVERESGAVSSSRLVLASTSMRRGSGDFDPVVVLGADASLPRMLDARSRAALDAADLPPLGTRDAYLEPGWARERGLGVGDRFELTTPTGPLTLRVAALPDVGFAANNGSAVVVRAATATAAFDRGSSVDMLLLRPGGDPGGVRERAAALVDGAADVVAPSAVFASYGRIYRTPLMLVAMFGAIALLVGGVLLFLTWRLVLADSRPTLSRLRLLGVRSGDLLLGSWLALVPVLLTSYAVGATAGWLVGGSLSSSRSQITNFTGQAFDLSPSLVPALLGGLVAALAMFGFAWLTGLRQLRRATAIDAIAGRATVAVERTRMLWPALIGLGCFAIAGAIVGLASGAARAAAGVPLVAGVVILSAVLPVLAGAAIRALSSGPSGLLVGRQLQVEWRRNAALGVTFAVALLGATTMFGAASSTRAEIDASNDRWTKGQLYVVAAPLGENYESERFPPRVRDEIEAVPGVRSSNTFSYVNAVVRGGRRLVETVGGDAAALTAPRLTEGPADAVDGRKTLWEVLRGDDIAVSSNFARTHDLGVGSTVEIPVSDGHRTGRVAAVIDDSISDGGMVMVAPELFRQVAGDARVYYVGVRLDPGADEAAVRDRLRAIVADRHPRAEVLTVDEYSDDVSSLLGRLMSSFNVFALVMYGVAGVVGTATLASSIAERRRAVGLTRLVGGRRRAVQTLLGIEATVTVTIAWVVAGLGGLLAIPAMVAAQSLFSGLLPETREPVGIIALSLVMTGMATALALLIARRSVGERPLAELVADE